MQTTRTLTLKKERLTELSGDDLRHVVGAEITGILCVTRTNCNVSNMAISLCGCFTEYCSIDVC